MSKLFTARKSPQANASRGADAYLALKNAIRETIFPPGQQASEQEIALRLGMSRTPVHEALIRLQEDGLVRVLPKRGILIVPLSPDDMREVYQVITALEATAADLLANLDQKARKLALVALETASAEMKAALANDDLNVWANADDAFHRALFDGCGNNRLARMAYTILDQSHRARMVTLRLRQRPISSEKEHLAIVSAIRSGNGDKASVSARAHRQRAANELLPLLVHLGMRVL